MILMRRRIMRRRRMRRIMRRRRMDLDFHELCVPWVFFTQRVCTSGVLFRNCNLFLYF
jgi:hypothetical protein